MVCVRMPWALMISVVIYLTNLQWELIKYQPLGMLIPTPASNTPKELPDIHLLKDPINKNILDISVLQTTIMSPLWIFKVTCLLVLLNKYEDPSFSKVYLISLKKKMGWRIFKCILKLYFKVSLPEEEKPSLPGRSQRMSGVICGMGEIGGRLKEKRKPGLLSWQSGPSFLVARRPVWMK